MKKYNIVYSSKFRKDFKKAKKRKANIEKFLDIIEDFKIFDKGLNNYKDHELVGIYSNYRECHVSNDYLLIYNVDESTNVIYLMRLGTHSDLFK